MMNKNNLKYIENCFELFDTGSKIREEISLVGDISSYYRNQDYGYYCIEERKLEFETDFQTILEETDILSDYDNTLNIVSKCLNDYLIQTEEVANYSELKDQLLPAVLFELLSNSISKELEKFKDEYSPDTNSINFSKSAVYSLTNSSYFYESSKCW